MSASRLERMMFSRVPLWLVILLAILALVFAIAFGNIAIHTFKGGKKAGALGDAVLALSDIPAFVDKLDAANGYLRVSQPVHKGKAGFGFSYAPGTRPDAGFLLLSRYDGDDRRSYVELWDLNARAMLHRWAPPIDEINRRSTNFRSAEVDLFRDRGVERMVLRHPLLMPDGSIVFKSRTPLTRIDACDRIVWINDTSLFHHALEQDADGNLWLSTRIEPATVPYVDPVNFQDDAITKVSPEGKILFQRSVADLLLKIGRPDLVYSDMGYFDNPIHLNDVQPVLEDGLRWKKGDLFLSLRNHSLVMLYRPATDEVLWMKQGPWSKQHDVDVLDDHRISAFDNHAYETYPYTRILGHSDVPVYDFATDTVSHPWAAALAAVDLQSVTEGLQTIRPNGDLFVEEQNRGRILEMDAAGTVIWDYVNRARGDGHVYRVVWSRLLEPDVGRPIAETLARIDCGG